MACCASSFIFEVFTDAVIIIKFYSSFIAMFCAIVPVSIIGTRFAMSIIPFWTPEHFSKSSAFLTNLWSSDKVLVPVVGMLSGNSISSIVVSIDYVLKEFVCVSAATVAIPLFQLLVVDILKVRTVIRLRYTLPSVLLDWKPADQLRSRPCALR